MAESKDSHVVVVEIGEYEKQKLVCATEQHPLKEISESAGHLLLLKLWQREEEVLGRRIAIKERRADSIRSEIFHSCCFFYAFYAFFMTLVYASSSERYSCRKWWIPSVLCVLTCIAMTFLVQMKVCRYWKVRRQLQREKSEARAVNRCIQELRMKGARFDLSKEPGQNATRMKSSSVEVKWKQPLSWCSHNFITIFLLCLTALAVPATKFILLCAS